MITKILLSQVITNHVLHWEVPVNEGSLTYLTFKDAIYNENHLPTFTTNIKVNSDQYDVQITDKVFVPITNEELKYIDLALLNSTVNVKSNVFKNTRESYLSVKILPLKLNPSTKVAEKLINFKIKYTPKPSIKNNIRTANIVSNSLMSSGSWLKVGVTKSGVYKFSYNQLISHGLSSPSNPRVFGYGGSVLPEQNSQLSLDDMNELSIKLDKGADGVFNAGDSFLFYAEGPLVWDFDSDKKQFRHANHHYSDTIFYFISTNVGQTKEISIKQQSSESASTIKVYLDKILYEKEERNLLKSGKLWLGEEYNNIAGSYKFDINVPNIVMDSLVKIHTAAAARCPSNSNFILQYKNENIQTIEIPFVNMSSTSGKYVSKGISFNEFEPESENISIITLYDQYSQYNAWLDYICLNPVRYLKKESGQLLFTNVYNIGGWNKYEVSNTSANDRVWDISSIETVQEINSSFDQQVYLKDEAFDVKSYIVFNPNDVFPVASIKSIKNQNLHGLENIEYVILTHPDFKSQAEQLANFHRTTSGLKTVVVTNDEVYNEFSSGTPDVTALKSMLRHFYHNKSIDDTLKYLLLFGDGSYDNKSQNSSNSNKILTYQSDGSINISGTFVSDDYYGLLDDNEGVLSGYLDIGIGRIIANNKEQADNAVTKILNYNNSFGNWRSLINFVADNGNGDMHIQHAEILSQLVETNYPSLNQNKIYIDAYPLEESAGGDIVPEATHDFNTSINNGTLILNYTGHGGELGLAHEQLITIQDILSWTNKDKLATFLTATCEFTRYDDKDRVSAGEYVFLNSNGGGIALFTTTRIAYANQNLSINKAFYNQLFNDDTFKMGDLIKRTKNAIGSSNSNMRIFTLIGDPALSLNVPKKNIKTIAINDIIANNYDTISFAPLSKVTIKGEVLDENDQLMSDFNGIVYPTVFDKADTLLTLCQFQCNGPVPFKSRKSIIYKGKASVKDGKFQFSFIVPKDISYKNGLGRISYYADNNQEDAYGYYRNVDISGEPDTNIVDNKGPEIDLFMNDENFIYGGTTDENPTLIATLYDDNGINTAGNGIGHDLTATLDQDNNQIEILNTYYEADLDEFQSGRVTYPYAKLDEGKHNLQLKAWDVFNNSTEQNIEFFVAKSTELAVKNIFNYPNPFTTNTKFYFDHNQANQNLEVLIQIFTVSGKLIKTLEANMITDGFRSEAIQWNGKDDYEDSIGKGVYIYKLKVRNEDGDQITEFQKLVILK